MQKDSGLHSFFKLPAVYSAFQTLIGSNVRQTFVADYIAPKSGSVVVDVGCGPGTLCPHFSGCDYIGIDSEIRYIESARRAFPLCRFEVGDIATVEPFSVVDFVIAFGLIHHLDDKAARSLFSFAHRSLKRGGKLITFDGVILERQNPVARAMLRLDRGKNVRTQQGYISLAKEHFSSVAGSLRNDLLHIPYDHFIMVCSN